MIPAGSPHRHRERPARRSLQFGTDGFHRRLRCWSPPSSRCGCLSEASI